MPSLRPEQATGSATRAAARRAGTDRRRRRFRPRAARRARRRAPARRDGRGGLRPRASGWTTSPGSPGPPPTSWTAHEHLIGGSYTLEVTSPGVDRPLTGQRHWRRAHLRQVAVRTRDGDALHRAGRAGRRRTAVTLLVDGGCASCATPTSSTPACRWSSGPRPRPSWSCCSTAGRSGGGRMNVDIAALRAIEREKDIPFETVIEAIETALLTAYRHTDGHQPHARIDIDRKTGAVRVLAQELAAGRRASSPSGTTPRRASAGSPPPPPARSSCSGCATPSTSAPTASSRPRRARSSPASCSATPGPTRAAW